jgi:hypothetical protein
VALLEKYRTVIYAHFVEHVGEEAAEAMLAQFPSRDVDEPATKEFVALQVAKLEARFAEVDAEFAKVRAEMAEMRAELVGLITSQMDRLMTRMQVLMGAGFGFLSVVLVLTR